MNIISPSTVLPVVYLIQDHTDVNTYYVQAVVKNSRTGGILETLNLTDNGDRRFTASFTVPQIEETYIDITTTVYSDAGYTTKAPDKYEVIDQYLIKTQWGLQFGGAGGGGGASIDYNKVRQIVKEVVSAIETPKEYDDSTVISKLNAIETCVNDIKPQDLSELKPKEVNFAPVMSKIGELKSILLDIQSSIAQIYTKSEEIYAKEPEKFNYKAILDVLSSIRSEVIDSIKILETQNNEYNNTGSKLTKIKQSLNDISYIVDDFVPKNSRKVDTKSRIANFLK